MAVGIPRTVHNTPRRKAHEGAPMSDTNNEVSGPAALPKVVDGLQSAAQDAEAVTLGQLTKKIGAQGHAPLLMVLAVLMILPTGMIPGIGGALGTLIAIIGVQILLGRQGVWLPSFLARREISADTICALTRRIRPVADWLKRHMQARWNCLSESTSSRALISVILIVTGGSLIVLGAIPIAVPLLGLPLAVFALGILGRDGVVVAIGYALFASMAFIIWMLWRSLG